MSVISVVDPFATEFNQNHLNSFGDGMLQTKRADCVFMPYNSCKVDSTGVPV